MLSHCISLYGLTSAFVAVRHRAYTAVGRERLRHDDVFLGDATTYRSAMKLDTIDGPILFRLGDRALQGRQPIPGGKFV